MPTPTQDELIDLWITALESGDFEPTKHRLRNNLIATGDTGEEPSKDAPVKYCCLGVLCESTAETMSGEWIYVEEEEEFYYYYPDEIPSHITIPIDQLLVDGIFNNKKYTRLDATFSYLPGRLIAALNLNGESGSFDLRELSDELQEEILTTVDLQQLQDRDDWEDHISLARLNDCLPSDENTFKLIAKILRERPTSLFSD